MELSNFRRHWSNSAAGALMLGLTSATAITASAQPASAQQAAFENVATQEHPAIEAPTAERPYYLATFDSAFKAANPSMTPVGIEGLDKDKLVVLNFISEADQFSELQTQVLQNTLQVMAGRSLDKDLMLVNISVTDPNGEPVYATAYQTSYEQNTLAGKTEHLEEKQLPYGAVYGTPLYTSEGDVSQLFDFVLMHDVKNAAEFDVRVQTIENTIKIPVLEYNNLHVHRQKPEPDNDPKRDLD